MMTHTHSVWILRTCEVELSWVELSWVCLVVQGFSYDKQSVISLGDSRLISSWLEHCVAFLCALTLVFYVWELTSIAVPATSPTMTTTTTTTTTLKCWNIFLISNYIHEYKGSWFSHFMCIYTRILTINKVTFIAA